MTEEARRERGGLRPWHVVLAMLGLLIAVIVLWMFTQGSGIKRQLAEIRAQGHPTSLAELSEMNKLPPGVQNAAALYEDAFSVFEDGQDHDGKGKDEVNRGDPHDWPFIVAR